ncbi:MAG: tRNA threonylcarbamoyladenosine dehydratase [Fibrobacteria bacterium]|nr:tRNA threonylcarbamoyladenosine dehydratase [Fibrobacteria bacterium]
MSLFSRTEMLIGKERCKRLAQSHVAVFGLGGVGSYAVEALARAGIGKLSLMDMGLIQPSNINRQLFALQSTLHQPKTAIAQRRIKQINPDCEVIAHLDFAHVESFDKMLATPPDIIIDAIDSLNPKIHLLQKAYEQKLPIISSMGAGNKVDPSLIQVGDISETKNCPLARIIRKRLHRLEIYKGITCVYSLEIPSNDKDAPYFEAIKESENFARGREREQVGSISYIPPIFGFMAAGTAIRKLAEIA